MESSNNPSPRYGGRESAVIGVSSSNKYSQAPVLLPSSTSHDVPLRAPPLLSQKHSQRAATPAGAARAATPAGAAAPKRFASARESCVRKLLESEASYVVQLNALLSIYITPLSEDAKLAKPTILPRAAHQKVGRFWLSVERIHTLNVKLLEDLKECVRASDGYANAMVGGVLRRFAPLLRMYAQYCEDHPVVLDVITKQAQTSAAFGDFLARAQANSKSTNANIRELMAAPVSRLSQYQRAAVALLEHTPAGHPDHDALREAETALAEAAHYQEEARDVQARRSAVQVVEREWGHKFAAPGRWFVAQGPLIKVSRKKNIPYQFIIFSDILAYGDILPLTAGRRRYRHHRSLPLSSVRVVDLADEYPIKFGFQIISEEKSFSVMASDAITKQSWLDRLVEATETDGCGVDGSCGSNKVFDESAAEAPVWTPDHAASHCTICSSEFTLLRRRHHCRRCGSVVCASCSKARMNLNRGGSSANASEKSPAVTGGAVRVCKRCVEEISHRSVLRNSSKLRAAAAAADAVAGVPLQGSAPAPNIAAALARGWRPAIALFDFAPTGQEADLGLREGEAIWIVASDGDGWSRGARRGEDQTIGYFPTEYVREVVPPGARSDGDEGAAPAELLAALASEPAWEGSVVVGEAAAATPPPVPTREPVTQLPVPAAGSGSGNRRTRIVREILSTERVYLGAMRTLLEVFVTPLLADSYSAHAGAGQVVAQHNESNSASMLAFLSNIEPMATLSKNLLADLESRLGAWDAARDGVGDLFLRYAPLFSIYDEYSRSYEWAVRTLDTYRRSHRALRVFLERQSLANAERLAGQSLESLTIMPIQRVPRYVLLLKELAKYTPAQHADRAQLEAALEAITSMAAHINEKIRERENLVKLRQIEAAWGGDLSLVDGHSGRVFLREGELTKRGRRSDQRYVFVLFSDALMYGSPPTAVNATIKHHRTLLLEHTTVRAAGGTAADDEHGVASPASHSASALPSESASRGGYDTACAFDVISKNKSFRVLAADATERDAWLGALEAAIFDAKGGDSGGEASAPIWSQDGDAPTCQMCDRPFTLLLRRHHCRACGAVVCDACSDYRVRLDHIASRLEVRRATCALASL